MKKNKTLFVSQQYKRRGFFYFLCVMFFIHLSYFAYLKLREPKPLLLFESIPEIFIKRELSSDITGIIPDMKLMDVKASALKSQEKSPSFLAAKPKVAKSGINSVSAQALESIYGIGPVLSKRIVKYRTALGGFAHMDQIFKVYGLDSLVVLAVKEVYKVVKLPVISKISINTANAYQLSRLPFLDRNLADKIVTYRAKYGLFKDVSEISNIMSLTEEKIDIIKLYLNL